MTTNEPMGYQGWTNYATWGVHLLITNESWEACLNATRVAHADEDGATLREYFREVFLTNPENDEYCYGNIAVQQMVEAALCEVNWYEVRDALVDSYLAEIADDLEGE